MKSQLLAESCQLHIAKTMLKNYLNITLRNFVKNRTFSVINILGLVIGITSCLLIGLYINYETSYDKHFQNADNIYRIAWKSDNPQTRTPHPMALAMEADFPEVVQATSLSPIWGPGLTRPTFVVEYEANKFDETGIFSADSTFFDVFSFDLISGNKKTALTQPGGIVITREMARKYFGSENALGKTLRINDRYDFEVTGVMQNIPKNTHFHFDFLISYVTLKLTETGEYYTWSDFGHFNYVVLRDDTDPKQLESRMPEWFCKQRTCSDESMASFNAGDIGFMLQHVPGIHLHSNIKWELEANNSISYIYIFAGAAVFILLIACSNFTNLTTARSLTRAKEVGLRKTVGAGKSQLIFQFISESVIMSAIAVFLSLFLLELITPWFSKFAGISEPESFLTLKSAGFLILGTILLGVVSGSYPAFVLSKFQPQRVLKGAFSSSKDGLWVRKGLVILQFSISAILIAGTLIIFRQLDYLKNTDLGFEKEQVAVIPIRSQETRERFDALKDELLKIPDVSAVTASSNIPGGTFNQQQVQWLADDPSIDISELQVDYDFTGTLGIDLVAGRGFSREYVEDAGGTFLINEIAAQELGMENPVGEEINFIDDDETMTGKIVGVVSDFHYQSLHQVIRPLIIQVRPDQFNYLYVKLDANNISARLAEIENIWHNFDPLFEFDYLFLNAEFESNYRQEEKAGDILLFFSALSILIACMGLFGLTSFSVQTRLKEIGVRKILGAGIPEIIKLFSLEFAKLVLISFIISIPVTIVIMNNWLQSFAYKTSISPGLFIISSVTVIIIAQLTITGITLKAAFANPVESLRSE